MFKSVNEAFNWMVSFTNLEKKPDLTKRGYRLDKMHALLNLFDNPQNSYKIIHVAGSKGKGSTTALISSILSEAGYKTGVYSSPHLLDYRERITCNHKYFKTESYISAISSIKNKLLEVDYNNFPGGEPTTFELMTLAALLIFKIEKCQWVVLETGIGGRLDSTNAVDPVTSVITRIELEHCDLLGNTIEEITFEKAGIIKDNRPVFSSNSSLNIQNVIINKAKETNSTITFTDKADSITIDNNGTVFSYNNSKYNLGLQGVIQVENAILALTVCKGILPEINKETIKQGLKNCSLPGRFQIVPGESTIVLDGAHTRNSLEATIDTFKRIYKDGVIIFGAVKGKDIDSMISVITQNFKDIIISKPGDFKESNIKEISKKINDLGYINKLIESPGEALIEAKLKNKAILVTGSFYMAGEIAKIVLNEK